MTTDYLTASDATVAGAHLRAGRLVVFPTETVYGLGAAAVDPDAVASVFAAKGRPSDNPLICHYSDTDSITHLLPSGSEDLAPLIQRHMPGPLTLVVPAPASIPPIVTAGLDSVAVRVPDHPVAQAVIAAAGVPVAAPSANRSGRPSPTTFEMARDEMDGRVAAIVDGGDCPVGIESTVVDVRHRGEVRVLRPGVVTAAEIAAATGRRVVAAGDAVRSPGTRHTHYRPTVPVIAVPPGAWEAAVCEARRVFSRVYLRRNEDYARYARDLYRTFWTAERDGYECILVETVPESLAPGLADRLERAADHRYTVGSIEAMVRPGAGRGSPYGE